MLAHKASFIPSSQLCTSVASSSRLVTQALTTRSRRRRVQPPGCPSPASQPSFQQQVSLVCQAKQSKATPVSSGLISVLKDELKVAKEAYRKDEELLEGPPNGFEIDELEGQSMFCLLKLHKGEQILVEVSLSAQLSADEDEDGSDDEEVFEEVAPFTFKVYVSKRGMSMVFDCESSGEYFSIVDMALEGSGGEDDEDEGDDEQPYTGPPFEELDDTLQQAFVDYLEERGITQELCEYMRKLREDKAAREYQTWLQKVVRFVAQ